MSDEPEVLCRIEGCAGIITLNRPKALNALNLRMVRQIRIVLDTWEDDDRVRCVMIEGAGGKAFCAGGDIRAMRHKALTGHFDEALTFWREEYQLNSRIFHYSKPYIALLDGIVMGGGAGLSLHGRYRIGTQNLMFAMPETGIGLFPDVGISYILSRLPCGMGQWLALTGERLGIAHAKALKLITHHVPAEHLMILRERLCASQQQPENIDEILSTFSCHIEHVQNEAQQNIIQTCFDAPDVFTIFTKLEQQAVHEPAAKQIFEHLKTRCPLSLLITYEQIKRARHMNMDDVLMMDYRLVSHMGQEPDFHEGVRAIVIDKDQNPRWHHQLHDLDSALLFERMFGVSYPRVAH